METAESMSSAFQVDGASAPVVNVSGVDAPTVTTSATTETATSSQKFYTEEDLAKVRAQEKSKLYPEIDNLKEEVAALKKEKEEKAARKAAKEAAEAADKDAKQKAKLEEDLDAKELIKLKEAEWQEQLERERSERERAFALLEQERNFAELSSYKQNRLEQERENIIPELLDLVGGNSPEEVDASLEGLKERSARILESAQSAMQNARKEMTGTRATLPPAGPLEMNTESRQFTAQDIASMSVNEYAKYRDKLLGDGARGKSRGMFS